MTMIMKTEKILWTFSIYLEAVAIVPQLVLLQRSRIIDNLTGNYVFLLGYVMLNLVGFIAFRAYRALYILNWAYRFLVEDNHHYHWIPWISGLVQTALYADFFYYYFKSWKNREKLQLPA
ncbi:ER lumen protein-retaining receptor [Vitis vinifera]|uniref:ER lumen protein-retaining receptor n=1 Tax=Vitis vinifera TaxID=29760 RepID=A0A438IYA1_VITVI|nr:ER lumen protein-retaining receptor [Vitis vinifera]